MDRLKMLEDFVAAKPDDPFPRYGLAMEHKNRGDLSAARGVFAELVDKFPDYVATYLMYGNTLAELGESEQARATYQAGLEVANKAGDGHTASELQTALAELRP
ncbi:MAG: tetratricopeptide repeat protein [Deltaproteobacteria bacterium]|nr:tetratricopeptide repeat protein [Deltaproteobacteria bacterium]